MEVEVAGRHRGASCPVCLHKFKALDKIDDVCVYHRNRVAVATCTVCNERAFMTDMQHCPDCLGVGE